MDRPAIGISRDVTRSCRRAVTILDAKQLDGVMLAEPFEEERGSGRTTHTPMDHRKVPAGSPRQIPQKTAIDTAKNWLSCCIRGIGDVLPRFAC
jgi:hypothetical protein